MHLHIDIHASNNRWKTNKYLIIIHKHIHTYINIYICKFTYTHIKENIYKHMKTNNNKKRNIYIHIHIHMHTSREHRQNIAMNN